jgi:hypothetical protein
MSAVYERLRPSHAGSVLTRFQTVDACTLAAPVTAHTTLAHRDRTDVYIALKDAPAFLASFAVAAVGESRHGTIEARTKPAGRCPIGWAGRHPDRRGSAGSTRADQQAFHPSGNGIRGQASWLSFVAFGGRLGEMAVLTASSNRSNSTSVIALSKFRRAEILTLRITIFLQINDAQPGIRLSPFVRCGGTRKRIACVKNRSSK